MEGGRNALGAFEELVSADHAGGDPGLLERDLDVPRQGPVPQEDRHVAVVDKASRVSDEVPDLPRDEVGLVGRRLGLVEDDRDAGGVRRFERLLDALRVWWPHAVSGEGGDGRRRGRTLGDDGEGTT